MFTVTQIEVAREKISSGIDFPEYIKEIKELGVKSFTTWVSDSHSEYLGELDYCVYSEPMYKELAIAMDCNAPTFKYYLKIHQQGVTDYVTFCSHCAQTGIEKWRVCLERMTCTYYDKAGNEVMVEIMPSV